MSPAHWIDNVSYQTWVCLCPHTQFLTISQQHNFIRSAPPRETKMPETKTNHSEWVGRTEGGFTDPGRTLRLRRGGHQGSPRCQEALLRVKSIPSPSQMARLPLLSVSLLLQLLQPWLGSSFLGNTNRQQRKCSLPLSLFQANPKSSQPGVRGMFALLGLPLSPPAIFCILSVCFIDMK